MKLSWLSLALLAPLAARADEPLEQRVHAIVAAAGDDVQVGLWFGSPGAAPRCAVEAERALPAASVVKTAILIELFAAHTGHLDEPLGAPLAALLADDVHPALAPFTAPQRAEIRAALTGASARTLGAIMMGSRKESNAVYNAAANLALALLGGPAAASAKIAARDPAFAGVAVRRYMLASRKTNGDNDATPASLAAVLGALASGRVAGVDAATVAEMATVMMTATDPTLGAHRHKEGNLDNDPMTNVKTGFYAPKGKPPIVYVVATVLPAAPSGSRGAAHDRLERIAVAIQRELRTAAAGADR
jgi:hypothetical protein